MIVKFIALCFSMSLFGHTQLTAMQQLHNLTPNNQEDPFEFLKLEKLCALEILNKLNNTQLPQEPISSAQFLSFCALTMIDTHNNLQKNHLYSSLLPQEIAMDLQAQIQDAATKKGTELAKRFAGDLTNEQLIILRKEIIDHLVLGSLKTIFDYLLIFYPYLGEVFGSFENFWANG